MVIELLDNATRWLVRHPGAWAPVALAAAGLFWLWRSPRSWSRSAIVVALVGAGWWAQGAFRSMDGWLAATTFWALAAAGGIAAGAMLAQRNPVYAALCFALVVLSASGLFLLQGAPFLAATTVIIYAGAVIVTFLFVVMMAQQRGQAPYDLEPNQPLSALVLGAALLVALAAAIHASFPRAGESPFFALPEHVQRNQSPMAIVGDSAGVADLGRVVYSDGLWGVELAGAILLAAAIGAVVIAGGRREEEVAA